MKHSFLAIAFLLLFFPPANLIAQPYEGQKGDVNDDGSINVLDMLTIANHILGIDILTDEEFWRADLNGIVGACDGDESANVLDMVKIANIILGSDSCPAVTVTDIDGNVYRIVVIGTQIWMAENLRVARYRNGDAVAGCWIYGNVAQNAAVYGRLYDWYAVDDGRGLAPEGWRVPTDDDWKELETNLGMSQLQADATGWRGTEEGGKLKATGTIEEGNGLWHAPNASATDESGFSALPAGFRTLHGTFSDLGYYSTFWSSTENDGYTARYRTLYCAYSSISRYSNDKRFGLSVRCIKSN